VLGKRRVTTRLVGPVTIRAEHAAAALEVMSRFAVHPKWLVYLPPTMSPVETSARPDALERPEEAFTHFREEGVDRVVCEEKHMGSRAVLVVARDAEAARRRFGVTDGAAGVCLTRTGRRFYNDPALETALVDRVRAAMSGSGLFDELATDWAVIDAELLPWSAKARELLRTQYAPVGAAARHALGATRDTLARTAARVPEAAAFRDVFDERLGLAHRYVAAYRRYCWEVTGLDGVRLAPFHLLATEGGCHVGEDHLWHLGHLGRLAAADPALFLATRHLEVETTNEASLAAGVAWWEALTAAGGEGMVVKPLGFVVKGRRGLAQPAVKVRGAEYLRIIYGPEYTRRVHLDRLRERGLGAKRSLARREFALGVEALERFVRGEPLRRVHECVFAVLALESEPVDPRL
jgi:protein phosphatase